MGTISIPNEFEPRPYQKDMFDSIIRGKHRVTSIVMARRHGKDLVALNAVAVRALSEVMTVWYILPYKDQVNGSIWSMIISKKAKKLLEWVFPLEVRKKTHENRMVITLVNGSEIHFKGGDNPDALVGSAPKLIVLSEAGLMRRAVYDLLRPIVLENGGNIVLISTVRGKNWFWNMIQSPSTNNKVYNVTIDDAGNFTPEEIEEELQECINTMGEDDGRAFFEQEYRNNPSATRVGSYYGSLLFKYEDNWREMVEGEKVYAAWDMGMNDTMVITLYQVVKGDVIVVGFIDGVGKTVDAYLPLIPYKIEKHFVPHDANQVRGYVSSKSAAEVLRGEGCAVSVLPKTKSVIDDINLVRSELGRIWFASRSIALREKLKEYSKKYDAVNKVYLDQPKHDQYSDYADSFRYMVISLKEIEKVKVEYKPMVYSESDWQG